MEVQAERSSTEVKIVKKQDCSCPTSKQSSSSKVNQPKHSSIASDKTGSKRTICMCDKKDLQKDKRQTYEKPKGSDVDTALLKNLMELTNSVCENRDNLSPEEKQYEAIANLLFSTLRNMQCTEKRKKLQKEVLQNICSAIYCEAE